MTTWPAETAYTPELVACKLKATYGTDSPLALEALAAIDGSYIDPAWKRKAVKLGCIYVAGPRLAALRNLVRMGCSDERDPMWRVDFDLDRFVDWLARIDDGAPGWTPEDDERYARHMSGGKGPEERRRDLEALLAKLEQDRANSHENVRRMRQREGRAPRPRDRIPAWTLWARRFVLGVLLLGAIGVVSGMLAHGR